jgi:hypothetical protein
MSDVIQIKGKVYIVMSQIELDEIAAKASMDGYAIGYKQGHEKRVHTRA